MSEWSSSPSDAEDKKIVKRTNVLMATSGGPEEKRDPFPSNAACYNTSQFGEFLCGLVRWGIYSSADDLDCSHTTHTGGTPLVEVLEAVLLDRVIWWV